MPEFRFKAFISYSHEDQAWARSLHRFLENYRTPKTLVGRSTAAGPVPARLSPVFRDRDELASSPELSAEINAALEASENLIVICSPAAAASRWVDQEIEFFKRLGRSARVFCMIVGGDPAAVGSQKDCFPPSIRARYGPHGEALPGMAEPVAADARGSGDGRALARLKIAAGLLNVGLDDLRHREMQRRYRRMAAITGGSVLGVALATVLAVAAIVARNEADQRRYQAEDLLGYLVGDLRDSLEPIGRLDLLEGVGQQAMSYFASVDVGRLTENELLRQSEVLTQLGEIRFNQLQYDQALEAFVEAYERSAALQRDDTRSAEKIFNRSQAEFWIGFAYWRTGDVAAARAWLTRYRDSSLTLSGLDPGNADWLREVAYGHHNLAVLDQESGNLEVSREGFLLDLETLRRVADRAPSTAVSRDVADTISWLGNISVMQGDLPQAVELYESSMEEIRKLADQDPDNARWRSDLAFAIQLVADTLLMTGDVDGAEVFADRAAALFDELVLLDPENTDWVRGSHKPQVTKGRIFYSRGELSSALAVADDAIAELEGLLAGGRDDFNVRNHLADAYQLLAWTLESAGDVARAAAAIGRAIEVLEAPLANSRSNLSRSGRLALMYIDAARLNALQGNDQDRQRSLRAARALIPDNIEEVRDPSLLDPWVRLLVFAGERGQARRIISALDASAYSPLRAWPD